MRLGRSARHTSDRRRDRMRSGVRGRSTARRVSAAAAASSTSRSRVRDVRTRHRTSLPRAPAPTRTSLPQRLSALAQRSGGWSSDELQPPQFDSSRSKTRDRANGKRGPGKGLLQRAQGRRRRIPRRDSTGRASGRSASARAVRDEAFVVPRLASVLPRLATKQRATSPRRRRYRMSVPWLDRRFGGVALGIRTSAFGSVSHSSR